MRRLVIYGGKPLRGTIPIQGSKNAVLPILAAALLCDEVCEIRNCPDLTDVHTAIRILRSLGVSAEWKGGVATVCAAGRVRSVIDGELMSAMRSSVMFLGSLLGRCKTAEITYPGGCALGARPIDLHLRSMQKLGVDFREKGERIDAKLERFAPQTVTLMFPSVGATENLMMLCAVSDGETRIVNAACEPEIVDLQNFLNAMGAKIRGAGTDTICVSGVKSLHGCRYTVIPDRIAAATYACAAVACGGDVSLTGVCAEHLSILLTILKEAGAGVWINGDTLRLQMNRRPMAVGAVKTLPYPGFATDMQPPVMAALLKSSGTTLFTETIFENRFRHVQEFVRMGAEIQVENMNAMVRGVRELYGASVEAADLRGGAALAVAGLSARGVTSVGGLSHIERGYENLAENLRALGADVVIKET